jgi:hypothetical protein
MKKPRNTARNKKEEKKIGSNVNVLNKFIYYFNPCWLKHFNCLYYFRVSAKWTNLEPAEVNFVEHII